MLTPKFKKLLLMCSFIALEQGKAIVDEYDEKMLYPMLLKCYHRLHPLFKHVTIDYGVDEDCSLNFFQMTSSTNEPRKNLLT